MRIRPTSIAAAPLVTLHRQKVRGPAAKARLTELFNNKLGLLAAWLAYLEIRKKPSLA